MIGPMVAEAAFLHIISISTIPGPTASAIALPLMPEKMTLASTLTCARPPRKRPMSAWASP